jgi:CubicO group peptidase (beta-lactamase class C family)
MKTFKKVITGLLILIAVMTFTKPVHSQLTIPENLTQKIDSLVALQLKSGEPGGAIGVLYGKQVLHKKSYGVMDLETGKPNDKNTLIDLASVAKQFTAFAIMLLEEQGKLDLDADIRQYLPELPDYGQTITIRYLLQHTSGIASTDLLRIFGDIHLDVEWSHQDDINLIKKYAQLNFEPNTSFEYSNGGYALLASIVESVSGKHFAGFLRENIFDPLGMKSSRVNDKAGQDLQHMAKGYRSIPDGFEHISSVNDFSYGSGNVLSNLDDMILWGQNFLDPKVGNEQMMERIFNKYNTLENGDSIVYTYGFYVRNRRGLKVVEHQGGVPGFTSNLAIYPNENLVIIVMLNNQSIGSIAMTNAVAGLLLSDKFTPVEPDKPKVEITLATEKAEPFQGTYRLEDGMEMTFAIEGDEFWILLPGGNRFRLYPFSETSFFMKEIEVSVSFIPENNGEVNQMIWNQRGRDNHALRVIETAPLTQEQLALFAGDYYQPYLETDYPVLLEDGRLKIVMPSSIKKYLGFESVQLSHIRDDLFATDFLGMMEFTRDDIGQVSGFTLASVGRLKNIVFLKK